MHYWKVSGKHWAKDATPYSVCSHELLLTLLESRPDVWSEWKAGKSEKKVARKGDANRTIMKELKAMKCPTARSDSAIGNYVSMT